MPKARQQHAAFGGTPDDVEAMFYEALAAGNLERLMACWADEDDIVCILPGGSRAVGAGSIRSVFEGLFAQAGGIHVQPQAVRRIDSLTSAVHNAVERVELMTPQGMVQACVVATNVYQKTPQGWRMVLHHSGSGTPQDAQELNPSGQVLH